MKKTLAILLSLVLFASVLAGCGNNNNTASNSDTSNLNSETNTNSAPSNSNSETDNNTANPAYDAILTEAYIVHFQPFFMMDTESFVLKMEDGSICCADYGYKDDVVQQWVETMYMPVSEYTDTQKTELENTMKTQFATVDALNCCTVTYKMSENYCTITCTYSDVDKAENYGELYNAQLLQTNTSISMSETETGLINQGFVKK